MTYTVLIIGCGAIAGGYDTQRREQAVGDDGPLSHAGAIAGCDRFKLVACVDPDSAVRKAFAAHWGVEAAAPTLDALGAQPGDYDLIVIASPTGLHAEHLEWALAMKPRTVFCEKPLAKDLAQAAEIAARYTAAGTELCVNYTRRWSPGLVHISSEIARGEYGELISAVGTYTKGVVHNGSHMIDLLRMLIGNVAIQSVGPARLDHWQDDPTVSAILTAPNGAPIHLVSGDARHVTQFELVLNFAKGQFAMRDGGRRHEFRQTHESAVYAGYREYTPPASNAVQSAQAMWNAYRLLGDAMDTTGPVPNSAQSALAAQQICEEIRCMALANMKETA